MQQKRVAFFAFGVFLALFVSPRAASAQLRREMPGNERMLVAAWIAEGKTLLHIRATAIHNQQLVSAILNGSRTRRIHVLLDQPSSEIMRLAGRSNLMVRLTRPARRGKFGREKLLYSFVQEIDKDSYETWYGPLIWTKTAFGSVFPLYGESGKGYGETGPQDVRAFDRDFATASSLKQTSSAGTRLVKGKPNR